ncbi:hypothetical protein THOG11_350021 [Vibrio harveyi]|nr:hypothetical protein TH15OA1_560007 [Vibrio harveyi]CAH1574696.1 hypothetical protein THOG11_350021 [Vibrio harveyi]
MFIAMPTPKALPFTIHISSYRHNALLRGEQRNTEAAAYRLNHLNQRIVKMPRVANPS